MDSGLKNLIQLKKERKKTWASKKRTVLTGKALSGWVTSFQCC